MTESESIPTRSNGSLVPLAAALTGGLVLGATSDEDVVTRRFGAFAALGLLGYAASHLLTDSVRIAGTRRRHASVHFSFIIARPVESVFAFCANFENFPSFITPLRDVRDDGDGRSHWRATTPGGGTLEWECITTKYVTNRVIAWRSVPSAPLEATGLLRFSPEDGGTCVKVELDYRVKEGTLHDAVAALVAPRRAPVFESQIRQVEQHIPDTPRAPLDAPAVNDSEAATRAP